MNTLEKIKTNNISIQQQLGAEILVNTLVENGVNTIFGYPGTPILSIYDALSKTDNIKHILTRHELGAIHAAEGYAKVSGNCGVVLVTSGPGFTNTITGIVNANTDGTPLVIISAQSETVGKNCFQDIDINNIIKSCSKKSYIITKSEDIAKTVTQAISEATKIPAGAVVIGITKSALETKTENKSVKIRKEIKVEAPHSCVLKAIDSLKNAKKPLIILGGGCAGSEDEIRELCALTHIPIVNTFMAKGVADDRSMGLIGYNGNKYLNEVIYDSDVVLALGTRFSDRTTCYKTKFLNNSKIISINITKNKSENVTIDKEIIGELKVVLRQMIGVIKAKNILFDIKYDWIEELSQTETLSVTDSFTPENILREIYEYTKKYNPVITTDVGEHQITAYKIFKTDRASSFLTSGGFGAMGFGLPSAIGAHRAKPNSLIMNITGDGSFQMNIQELGTCAEYNVPVKIIVINNSSLEMIKTQQKNCDYAQYQSSLINPDFAKLASAYGILGYTITNMPELKTALKEIFTYKKAVVLDIKVQG